MLRKVYTRKLKILSKGVNMLRKVKRAYALDPSKNKNPSTDYVKGVNICRNVIKNPAQIPFFIPFSGGQYAPNSPIVEVINENFIIFSSYFCI